MMEKGKTMKKVFIYTNDVPKSLEIVSELHEKLPQFGFEILENYRNEDEPDLIICVGGDGTLLSLMHQLQFPTTPIAGINTGHLGFFQENDPDKIDHFIELYTSGNYNVQPYNIAKMEVTTEDGIFTHRALNEFVIKAPSTHSVHYNISINDSFIEKYSGDGMCIATPAGSTAYNYSLGGSLVDPRLNLLQVTPMAPMNTSAYRSLTSSILLPANDKLIVTPCDDEDLTLEMLYDGRQAIYEKVHQVTLILSRRKINLIRLNDTTFWDKVKQKIL